MSAGSKRSTSFCGIFQKNGPISILSGRYTIGQPGGEPGSNNQENYQRDQCTGIPAEEKSKIFDRGFGKNTGRGLFLTREILEITGITIKVTGEPGKGARFEMTVPKGDVQITIFQKWALLKCSKIYL